MPLSVRLLGTIEIDRDHHRLPTPVGAALEMLVYLVAHPAGMSWPELETLWPDAKTQMAPLGSFGPDLMIVDHQVRLVCTADLLEYRAAGQDLRQLNALRATFAPELSSANENFQTWLERTRFDIEHQFLTALLGHAAGLERRGLPNEANENLAYVKRARQHFKPAFAAIIDLELARHAWALNRPQASIALLEASIPALEPALADEARVNLGAALVRSGHVGQAQHVLSHIAHPNSLGWALVHRANAQRIQGNHHAALETSEQAFAHASQDRDGQLAVSALSVKGETLLEMATQTQQEPKDAVIAFGKALGIAEMLGEDASNNVLAGLAHAHAVWGNKQKALEMAEKAFKRARAAKDEPTATRALLALYATTRVLTFARNALNGARVCQHKPLELAALHVLLEREPDPEHQAAALELSQLIATQAVKLVH